MASDKKVGSAVFHRIIYPAPCINKTGKACVSASYYRYAIFYCAKNRAGSVLVWRARLAVPCVIGNDNEKLRD